MAFFGTFWKISGFKNTYDVNFHMFYAKYMLQLVWHIFYDYSQVNENVIGQWNIGIIER